jgi:RNA polymerase sigma-70 factor (ECF subfamily)
LKSDEQLVEAAKQGSSAAFSELVGRHQQRLLRFLLTRCATRSDAEDVLQDSFINAYRYLRSYNPRWRFSTWLYRIAIRNAARLPRPLDVTTDEVVDDVDLLQDCIAQSERANLWLTAKKLLSNDAYAAMWLRYVEDLPVKDVANALDRSVSWTKVTLLRCRRRLQAELGDESLPDNRGEMYG